MSRTRKVFIAISVVSLILSMALIYFFKFSTAIVSPILFPTVMSYLYKDTDSSNKIILKSGILMLVGFLLRFDINMMSVLYSLLGGCLGAAIALIVKQLTKSPDNKH